MALTNKKKQQKAADQLRALETEYNRGYTHGYNERATVAMRQQQRHAERLDELKDELLRTRQELKETAQDLEDAQRELDEARSDFDVISDAVLNLAEHLQVDDAAILGLLSYFGTEDEDDACDDCDCDDDYEDEREVFEIRLVIEL
jgi:DNA repair exonuclease SbcCD ATPase subunit